MSMERENEGRSMGMSGPSRSIVRTRRRGTLSRRTITILAIVVAIAIAGTALAVYWPRPAVQYIQIDGSSTVFPITSAWAGEFTIENQRYANVAFSGTGGGFQKFCRGETDLSDASRPIRQSERDACTAAGITGIVEFRIAYDGLSIVVNKNNNWVTHLTVKELCRIWTSNTSAGACSGAGPRVTQWSELNATWPAQPISLWGPGTDSGTFDYFVEVILGNREAEHTDAYNASEDDNVLVSGVEANLYAVGYFGYAYVVPNLARLTPLAIDDENATNGDGPIAPSEQTIRDNTYAPLSRPLFIYGATGAPEKSLNRAVVKDFLRFGFSTRGMELVAQTGYVGLTSAEIAAEVAKIPP